MPDIAKLTIAGQTAAVFGDTTSSLAGVKTDGIVEENIQ